MRRIEAFLYSRRNIVGSLLALGGLALYFVGLLGGLSWLPIVVGPVPDRRTCWSRPSRASRSSSVRPRTRPRSATDSQRLLRGLRGKVADDLYDKVVSIQASILATLETERRRRRRGRPERLPDPADGADLPARRLLDLPADAPHDGRAPGDRRWPDAARRPARAARPDGPATGRRRRRHRPPRLGQAAGQRTVPGREVRGQLARSSTATRPRQSPQWRRRTSRGREAPARTPPSASRYRRDETVDERERVH